MKKTIFVIMISLLFITGIGTSIATLATHTTTQTTTDIFNIAPPHFTTQDDALTITVDDSDAQLLETGKPMLPIIAKTYEFPFGTRITSVTIDLTTHDYPLQHKIAPTPATIITDPQYAVPENLHPIDESVYTSTAWYPATPYHIEQTVGLSHGVDLLSVAIQIIPQYAPAQDLLRMPTTATVHMTYFSPQTKNAPTNTYDLLIITDETFVSALQPLAQHKNNTGMRTMIVTTQSIYSAYHGRDDAESIKLRIKDAKEQNDIKYVLLAGGRKGQTLGWIIPERVTHNPDDFESGTASDLYFGDLYRVNHTTNLTEFEDWDSNHNNIFAEFSQWGKKDIIDYVPDVAVGRLPFRTTAEIKPVVDKIIAYETGVDNSWFKTAKVFAGDTAPPARGPCTPGYYEGEIATNITANMLEHIGFTVDRYWTSRGDWTGRNDVVKAINEGCGFIHFAGHGNPAYWGNFKPDAQTEDGMVDGLILRDMPKLKNGEKLPVIVVGGCHNAQFNVTMWNIFVGIKEYGFMGMFLQSPYRFYYMEWVPRDWCSSIVFAKGGGGIASMGESGLGLGYVDAIGLSDWLDNRFFQAYANQSIHILGDTHGTAIGDYIHLYGQVNSHFDDRKTVEEFTLIGDPSLRIGGV
jgi:hypothetical protein